MWRLFCIIWVSLKRNHMSLYEGIFNSHGTGSEVTTEVDVGPMWPWAWECNSHQDLEESKNKFCSSLPRGRGPADTLIWVQRHGFQTSFWPPEWWENKFQVPLSHKFITICYSSNRKLIHKPLTPIYMSKVKTTSALSLHIQGSLRYPELLTCQLHTQPALLAEGGLSQLMGSACLKQVLKTKQIWFWLTLKCIELVKVKMVNIIWFLKTTPYFKKTKTKTRYLQFIFSCVFVGMYTYKHINIHMLTFIQNY